MEDKNTKGFMMAKRGRPPKGEQLPLIDIGPENQKEILRHAGKYDAAMRERMRFGKIEADEKRKVLELIKAANLRTLEDGKIKARCGEYTVVVTPRDELVQIERSNERKVTKNKSMQEIVSETE